MIGTRGFGQGRGQGGQAICVTNRYLPDLTRDGLRALVRANDPPTVFVRGGRLVRLRLDGGPSLETLDPAALKGSLARAARWYSRDGDRQRPSRPPGDMVSDILSLGEWLEIPVIERLVRVPVFGRDGVLQTSRGYSAATHTYLHLDAGLRIGPVAERPTRSKVEEARRLWVDDLLGDFPFASPADTAHAVGLGLLPFVRDLIDGPTPQHLVESPSPGTGKTLMTRTVLSPAVGASLAEMPPAATEDEWRKRLTAKLIAGAEAVYIDNLPAGRSLSSAALSAAISSHVWEDRVLGESEVVRIRPRCVWVATGNNISLSNELARRSVRIRLDAATERPWTRTGYRHPDLTGWAAEHRGDLIQAVLILGRAWLAEGRPPGAAVLGGFESWSAVIGGILEVAGVPGFLANSDELWDQADAEGAELGAFLGAWWDKHGTDRVRASDLQHLAPQFPTLFSPAPGDDHAAATSFGRQLAALRGRVADGKRIASAAKHQGFASYRLEEVGNA